MDNNFEIIVVVVIGIILILLFCTLYLPVKLPVFRWGAKQKSSEPREDRPGDRKFCLVCSAKLDEGQLVSSVAYPASKGSKDRLMHIRGCTYCLSGQRERICPVCKIELTEEDHLISRLFERSIRRSHVHVIGCSKCRGPRSGKT